MRARVVTLPLNPVSGCFDDAPLVEVMESHDVQSMSEHLIEFEGRPAMVFVLRIREADLPTRPHSRGRSRPQDELLPEERGLFETLRSWRNERAKQDGRPAYVLFTNAQLAEIATTRPSSMAELHKIEGVGDARIQGYREEILGVVNAVPQAAEADVTPEH